MDSGVEQEIRSMFSENSDARPSQLPPGVFSNRIAEQHTVTVIVLDQLNCLFEDEAYGRSELLKFLRTAVAGHRIALLSLSSELKVLHELTTDAGSVAQTLERFLPGRSVTAAALRPMPTNVSAFQRLDAMSDAAYARERGQQTAIAAAALGRYLARIPGRKNLIWMSSTFPGSLVARVREDDVAIYPIDVRGIKAPKAEAKFPQDR